ncbi:response regulator transcription factor [Coprobacillaceae bacterium CR2/5/TPMF4]|nr:response regulator transcription factor [Coprobacillaceae bacterium CR2/5/TPMF4]
MITILVVDDDKNTRLFTKSLLENENYNVVLANDGKDALECLDQKAIDLMIVDIMMPNFNGFSKAKTIDRKMGYLVGIDDYMSKPVDEEEFILKIKALLRRAKINDERKIRIGDVVLDYDSFTVSRKDEVVELPKRSLNYFINYYLIQEKFLPEFN